MWIVLILIAMFSGIVAGMGIGGGSIFILLTTIFNVMGHKEAQAYNLIMFIVVGISATVFNIKKKNIDIKLFKKLIVPICIGSIIGIFLLQYIDSQFLQKIFYYFMVIIGIYEIITSLKSIIKAKNNINNRKE